MADEPVVNRTEIDGIPVYWVDAPPFAATIHFRVGVADEKFLTRGISHLSEHIALDPFHVEPYSTNGRTSYDMTSFMYQGNPDRLGGFVEGLAGFLGEPHLDHFDREVRVLRAESAQGSPGQSAYQAHFGFTGPGLLPLREWGLDWLGPEHVGRWTKDRFNASNMAVVLYGPPPDDLRLPFAPGLQTPLPEPGYRSDMPSAGRSGSGLVSFSSVVPRRYGVEFALTILRSLCLVRARLALGDAYDFMVEYFRISRDEAIASLVAICNDDRSVSVAEIVFETLDEVRRSGVPGDVHERALARLPHWPVTDPNVLRAEAESMAYGLLLDWEIHPFHEREARWRVGAEEARELLQEFADGLHVVLPDGAPPHDLGLPDADTGAGAAPLTSAAEAVWSDVGGDGWPGPGSVLAFDDRALQIRPASGPTRTVHFDRVVAILVFNGIDYVIFDANGSYLGVTGSDWDASDSFWDTLGSRLPLHLMMAATPSGELLTPFRFVRGWSRGSS